MRKSTGNNSKISRPPETKFKPTGEYLELKLSLAPVKITVSTRSCFYPTILSPPPLRSLPRVCSSFQGFHHPWLAAPRVCRPSVVSFSFAFDHVLRTLTPPLRLYSFLRVNSPPYSPSNRLLTPSLIPANDSSYDAIQLSNGRRRSNENGRDRVSFRYYRQ